ncbi:MAG: phosphodiester glycosidase family protein [Anaerolineae bacterium]|nr:phosphodiester glycosidase family protein [Anaerolineae bacterium]
MTIPEDADVEPEEIWLLVSGYLKQMIDEIEDAPPPVDDWQEHLRGLGVQQALSPGIRRDFASSAKGLTFAFAQARSCLGGWLLSLLVLAWVIGGGPSASAQGMPPALPGAPIFQGITYERIERTSPRPLIVHVVRVDLTASGVRFFVTPGPLEGQTLYPRTTLAFLAEFGVQVAINANYYYDVTPSFLGLLFPSRQPVMPLGLAVSEGAVVSPPRADLPSLFLTGDNRATIGFVAPAGPEVYNAISGNHLILDFGQMQAVPGGENEYGHHPRTAAALDWPAETLFLVVVDGRQEGISEGVSLPELAELLIDLGAWVAINLDGGGSSVLVIEGPDGGPQVLSAPIDRGVRGRQRPVANHLGVYALPLSSW